jgi:ornithine decarboxylase
LLAAAAVKCNPDPNLLKLLADLGTGFDCASIEELRTVLSLGVDPSRIIFANPCKSASSLVFAARTGVTRTTFDNLDELDNIRTFLPNAQLVLRIFASDSDALINLGEKFGATVETSLPLLQRARELGLDVCGVSFHVGMLLQQGPLFLNVFTISFQGPGPPIHQPMWTPSGMRRLSSDMARAWGLT